MALGEDNCYEAGYTCTFLEEPPELFKCGVCRLVLRDPQITECCRKNACHPCIEKAINRDGSCPIPGCRDTKVKGFSDRTLKYEILERKVYCSSRKDALSGCEWIGKLENLDKHLEECPFHEIKCQYRCGVRVQRQNMRDHKVTCEKFPLECFQCGNKYERQHHDRHLKVCPFTTNDCPFKIVGCKSQFLNKDLPQHFNKALSDHYSLVAKQSHDVEVQVNEMESIFGVRKDTLSKRNGEITKLNDELKIAQERVALLQKAIKEAEIECEELRRNLAMIKDQVDHEVIQRDSTFEQFKKNFGRLILESKVRCFGPTLPRPSNIVSRPLETPPTLVEYTPKVEFSILNFQKERENDALLYLPPFFTHAGGYKMCLLVHCNGHNEAKNKSISIHVRVMKGQYDDHLQWPMSCRIIIELNNIQYVRSYSKTIHVRFCSPEAEDVQFNSIKELEALRPLIDGCLMISVSKVTVH